MRLIHASDIEGMHKTDLREDMTSFVHCTLVDGTNCWVERNSLEERAPMLADRLKTIERYENWDTMKIGGRPCKLTKKSECVVRFETIETTSDSTTHHDVKLKQANEHIAKTEASIGELRAQIADLMAKREIERSPCVYVDHVPIAMAVPLATVAFGDRRQRKNDSRVELETLPTPRTYPSGAQTLDRRM
jgi:hypothetical protein